MVNCSELALALKRREHTLIDFIGEIKDNHCTTTPNMRDYTVILAYRCHGCRVAKPRIEYDTGYTMLPGAYQIKVRVR